MNDPQNIVQKLQRTRWKDLSEEELARAFVQLALFARTMGIAVMFVFPQKRKGGRVDERDHGSTRKGGDANGQS